MIEHRFLKTGHTFSHVAFLNVALFWIHFRTPLKMMMVTLCDFLAPKMGPRGWCYFGRCGVKGLLGRNSLILDPKAASQGLQSDPKE